MVLTRRKMVAAVFKENVEKVIRFPDIRFEVSLFLTLCKPSYIITLFTFHRYKCTRIPYLAK